jgi:hypothetical protein
MICHSLDDDAMMVHRFSHANGLPVILLPGIAATVADQPLDAYDDVLQVLCIVLAEVGINFIAIVTVEMGRDRRQLQQIAIPAAAPYSLSGLSEDKIASLRTLKIGMYHSRYIENFFSMLRGGSWGLWCNWQWRNATHVTVRPTPRPLLGGKSFRPDPTPRPLVWRTGAVGYTDSTTP